MQHLYTHINADKYTKAFIRISGGAH